jgi:hypothetical protein
MSGPFRQVPAGGAETARSGTRGIVFFQKQRYSNRIFYQKMPEENDHEQSY